MGKNSHAINDTRVKTIAYAGIFTAAIAIVSAYVKVPVINGYAHIGDGLIMFAAACIGPAAALPAGIGSMIADILAGYPQYILPTLIVKSLMGLISGLILHYTSKKGKKTVKIKVFRVLAIVLSEAVMVFGYHIAGEIMYGKAAAIGELIGNICQAVIGIVMGLIFLSVASYFSGKEKYVKE